MDSAELERLLCEAGVARWGAVRCQPVESWAVEIYDRFLAEHRHGTMGYLERYGDVRRDPRLLLDSGAQWMIVCAIPYYNHRHNPLFSQHSQLQDYHYVIKKRLRPVRDILDPQGRICVDTAPVRERYWAWKAGLGTIGLNNQLIIPGLGSYFFLAEIVVHGGDFEESSPQKSSCEKCGQCIGACPGQALDGQGSIDARRCLAYQSMECGHINLNAVTLIGCDACQQACPMNANPLPATLPEFQPREKILSLDRSTFKEMPVAERRHLLRSTPLARALKAKSQEPFRGTAAPPSQLKVGAPRQG